MAGEQVKQDVARPDQLAGVQARAEQMGSLVQQLENARSVAARTRLILTIVVVLLFLAFGLMLWQSWKTYPREELTAQLTVQMLQPESGTLSEAKQMAMRVLPVYRAEAQKQFSEAWPEMREEIQTETKDLVDSLRATAEAEVKDSISSMIKRQEERVLAAFPELKDEADRATVMDNLEIALRDAVVHTFEWRIQQAEERINEIHAKILGFLPEEAQEPFAARMTGVWDNFLLFQLKGHERIEND